ncbi:hypothetical protein LTR66_005053 [Elasticomyces elasticus]|nr:hypothetical protein LTR66_005053 [Elasticomyces elasticus]
MIQYISQPTAFSPFLVLSHARETANILSTWAGNFQHQTNAAFSNLGMKDYMRLIVIIGAYCLLRTHLMKLGAKLQAADHANPVVSSDGNPAADHRDEALPGLDYDSDEDEESVEPGDFGGRARLRQRRLLRRKMAEYEQRLLDEQAVESDKDIEEFLEDD